MSLSTESTEGESGNTTPTPAGAPATAPLLAGAAGDRCTNCNARLAIDQRYCVECGTRRGNPRFTLVQADRHAGAAPAVGQIAGAAITRVQLLLALVMVLLAVGVGVLIGQGTSKTPKVVLSGTSLTSGATKSGAGSSGSSGKSSGAGSGSSSGSQPFASGS